MDDDDMPHIIRAKWTMDDAATLDQCVERLYAYAEHLKELKRQGWELINPVSDDYGFLENRKEQIGRKREDEDDDCMRPCKHRA